MKQVDLEAILGQLVALTTAWGLKILGALAVLRG